MPPEVLNVVQSVLENRVVLFRPAEEGIINTAQRFYGGSDIGEKVSRVVLKYKDAQYRGSPTEGSVNVARSIMKYSVDIAQYSQSVLVFDKFADLLDELSVRETGEKGAEYVDSAAYLLSETAKNMNARMRDSPDAQRIEEVLLETIKIGAQYIGGVAFDFIMYVSGISEMWNSDHVLNLAKNLNRKDLIDRILNRYKNDEIGLPRVMRVIKSSAEWGYLQETVDAFDHDEVLALKQRYSAHSYDLFLCRMTIREDIFNPKKEEVLEWIRLFNLDCVYEIAQLRDREEKGDSEKRRSYQQTLEAMTLIAVAEKGADLMCEVADFTKSHIGNERLNNALDDIMVYARCYEGGKDIRTLMSRFK